MNSRNMVNLKCDKNEKKCDHCRDSNIGGDYYVVNNYEQTMEKQTGLSKSTCQKCISHQNDSENNCCQNHDKQSQLGATNNVSSGECVQKTQIQSHVILQSTIEKQQQMIMQLMDVILNRMNEPKTTCTCCRREIDPTHSHAHQHQNAPIHQHRNGMPCGESCDKLNPANDTNAPTPLTQKTVGTIKDCSKNTSRKSSTESLRMVLKRAPSPKPKNKPKHKRKSKRRKSKKLNSTRLNQDKGSESGKKSNKRKKRYHSYFISDCSEFSTTALSSSEDNWCPEKIPLIAGDSTDTTHLSTENESSTDEIKSPRVTRSRCKLGSTADSPFVKRKASKVASKKISTILSQDDEVNAPCSSNQNISRKGGLFPSPQAENSLPEEAMQTDDNATNNLTNFQVPKSESVDMSGANIFLPFVQQLWSNYNMTKMENIPEQSVNSNVFPYNSPDVKRENDDQTRNYL